MELLVKRFTLVYQQLCEGTNLAQMRLTGPLKAYVLVLNAQMSAISKLDNLAKNVFF